ncbi:MAG: DUF1592 domain-containing protein [Planctomycetota bacterium]
MISLLATELSAERFHNVPRKVPVPREQIDGFLNQFCIDCHNDEFSEGGFNLDRLGNDLSDAATFSRWVRVIDRVQLGEMPPEEPIQADDQPALVDRLHPALDLAHQSIKATTLRRLNRREYENTLNDIFGTHELLAERLPEDGKAHAFDTIGKSLGLSPSHLHRYLNAADTVLKAAIATTVEAPAVEHIRANYAESREAERFLGKFWDHLPDGSVAFYTKFGYPTGMLRGTQVPTQGRYQIRITGYAYRSERPITARISGTSFVRGSDKPTYAYVSFKPGEPQTVELNTWIEDRMMVAIDPCEINTGTYNIRSEGLEGYDGPGLAIKEVELIGPLSDSFPSRGHRLIFDGWRREAKPQQSRRQTSREFDLKSSDLEQSVVGSLTRVANALFRRPVNASEISDFIRLFDDQTKAGESDETALRTAVAAMLCSPDFLYLNESPGKLSDHQVASRLSYFLHRTTPDENLRKAADDKRLANHHDEIRTQTHRLMNDQKFDRFITDFTDGWLNLREIDATNPDQTLFPEYDAYLEWSMLDQTRSLVRRLLIENRPIQELIQNDIALVNERLARHYGIDEPVHGPDLRPVKLSTNSVRGGVLSHASILKVSANGTNTSPVNRGVWLMERILGKPPQPPPPGIPGIEPDIRGATTLRELLDSHRNLDSCRACHQSIDPPGFALEVFNPIGGFRTRFRSLGEGEKVNETIAGRRVRYRLGQPVDASGSLPSGFKFESFIEFRDHLAQQQSDLAYSFTNHLLTFATGREMGYSDRPEIRDIVMRTRDSGYRVRDLLLGVVTSVVFLEK